MVVAVENVKEQNGNWINDGSNTRKTSRTFQTRLQNMMTSFIFNGENHTRKMTFKIGNTTCENERFVEFKFMLKLPVEFDRRLDILFMH